MMDVRPLHSERDYDWAIRDVVHYFEVDPAELPMEIVSRFCLFSSRTTRITTSRRRTATR
jgi:antitoxin component HigA of HigAB toxin-antitoxin module